MKVPKELEHCVASPSVWFCLDQAIEDIRMLGRQGQFICPVCSRYDHGKGLVGECVKCLKGEDCFEWRGVQHG